MPHCDLFVEYVNKYKPVYLPTLLAKWYHFFSSESDHILTSHPYPLICRSQLYRPVPGYARLQSDIWGESWHVWRGIRVISLLNSCVCCHLRSASPSAAACSANRLPQNMHFKAVLRTKVSQAKLFNQVLWYILKKPKKNPVSSQELVLPTEG